MNIKWNFVSIMLRIMAYMTPSPIDYAKYRTQFGAFDIMVLT